ncbi:MAG: 30S ribosomal protein S11, partial [Candidatus Zixiibacteriota bacterium]
MADPKKKRASKKKAGRVEANGVVHIKATFNNTIITIADTQGRVVSWG